jgi:hypothetical protein
MPVRPDWHNSLEARCNLTSVVTQPELGVAQRHVAPLHGVNAGRPAGRQGTPSGHGMIKVRHWIAGNKQGTLGCTPTPMRGHCNRGAAQVLAHYKVRWNGVQAISVRASIRAATVVKRKTGPRQPPELQMNTLPRIFQVGRTAGKLSRS